MHHITQNSILLRIVDAAENGPVKVAGIRILSTTAANHAEDHSQIYASASTIRKRLFPAPPLPPGRKYFSEIFRFFLCFLDTACPRFAKKEKGGRKTKQADKVFLICGEGSAAGASAGAAAA